MQLRGAIKTEIRVEEPKAKYINRTKDYSKISTY